MAHHFYLHRKYFQDKEFPKDCVYPYLKDVITYPEQFTIVENRILSLPPSSSPECNNNRVDAWFKEMTNFDRAPVRFAFSAEEQKKGGIMSNPQVPGFDS